MILVVDNPALPNSSDCISRQTSFTVLNNFLFEKNNACFVPLKVFLTQTKVYRMMLDEVKKRHPENVEIFDPTEIYCDAKVGICGPNRNGRILYSYTDHISDYAAKLVGEKLNALIEAK